MENILYVPMALEALCVTTKMFVPEHDKWNMQYEQLANFETAEPSHYEKMDEDTGRPPGVYLSWTLPLGLRTASEDKNGQGVAFAKIPNRYLVVRRHQDENGAEQAQAWIIVSDGAGRKETFGGDLPPAKTKFLDPSMTNTPNSMRIGIKVPAHQFDTSKHKSAFKNSYALDAGGCGNPAFTVFTPQNCNVLSFYDPVSNIHVRDNIAPSRKNCIQSARLHYTVLGWYDRPELSPLAGLNSDELANELAKRAWRCEQPLDSSPTLIVCGSLDALKWERDGSPEKPYPESDQLKLAFAPSLMEGLDTLLSSHAGTDHALNAFYNTSESAGFAAILNQQTELAPEAISRERHSQPFAVSEGSRRYTIASTANVDESQVQQAPSQSHQQTLRELHAEANKLTSLQNEFSHLCNIFLDMDWRNAYLTNSSDLDKPISGLPDDEWGTLLSTLTDQRAATVERLIQHDEALKRATQQLNQKEIAFNEDLGNAFELRISAAGRNYLAQDPLLVLAGARGILSNREDDALLFGREGIDVAHRTPVQLEPAWSWVGGAPWAALSDNAPVAALRHGLAEFSTVLPGDSGTFGSACRRWRQPWAPLFLEWELSYTDAPLFTRDKGENWRFTGRDYVLDMQDGKPHDLSSIDLARRSVLTPAIRESMGIELRRILKDHQLSPEEIDKRVAALDRWDFLSQRLSGLFDELRGRDARPYFTPNQEGKFVPENYIGVPRSATLDIDEKDEQRLFHSSSFRRISGGQFRIRRLQLVDRFGQVVPIAGTWGTDTNLTLNEKNCFIAPSMQATYNLLGKEDTYCSPSVQLPPRILQAARLEFHLRAVGNTIDGLAGWWTWNRYNRALMIHTAQGEWLGMLHPIAEGRAAFESAQGGSSLEDLAASTPIPRELLAPLQTIVSASDGEARLMALAELLDEASWRIDPADEHSSWLSVLTTRPLAVVGANVRFMLEHGPMTDPSWLHAFGDLGLPPEFSNFRAKMASLSLPDPLKQAFPFVIGNALDPEEGLVGLWSGDDYGVFRSPYANEKSLLPGITILNAENPLYCSFTESEGLSMTLLMDPFAKVYACSGLLPDQALSLPPQSFDHALRKMTPVFPMGPLLVEYEAPADTHMHAGYVEPKALLHTPIPPHEFGDWQWFDGNGQTFNLRHPGQEAHIDSRSVHVRDGRMVQQPYQQDNNDHTN